MYISEDNPPDGVKLIEWLLATNENIIIMPEDAIKIAEYYV